MFQSLHMTHYPSRNISALDRFRINKNRYFATDPQSPLTMQQRAHFRGLAYFPEHLALRQELTILPCIDKASVDLQLSTGGAHRYHLFGYLRVNVEGETIQLTVFSSEDGYFLPFVDALAGVETYSAGRYLEPTPLDNGRFLVDFNYAYNPYCAYNNRWSCPMTPTENRVHVAIRAGEKIYIETEQ